MASDIGVKMSVEGDAAFRQSMKESTASVKAIDSEVNLSAASFDSATDKMANLQERSSLLKTEIDQQSAKIQTMNGHLEDLKKEYGDNSIEVNTYTQKVNKAKTELEGMKTSLKETGDEIKNQNTSLKDASQKWTDFGESCSKISSKLKLVSAAAAGVLTYAFKSASDLEENIGRVQTSLGDAGDAAISFSKTTLDSFGVSQSSALDMMTTYSDLATQMGLSDTEAEKLGEQLIGRAGDLAAYKNISLDVASTGLSGIFTGQAKALKSVGIIMSDTKLEAYALANGYEKQYKDMTDAEKVMLRYNFVMDASQKASGEYADTQDSAATSMRALKETFKTTAASLGEQLIPTVVPLMQKVTDFLTTLNSLNDGQKDLIVNGLGVLAIASPALKIVGGIADGIGKITKNWPLMQAAGTTAIEGIKTSALGFNTALTGTPLGIILLAIAGGVTLAELVGSWTNSQEATANAATVAGWTSGKSEITATEAQYYKNVTQVGFGTDAKYYANTSSSNFNNSLYQNDLAQAQLAAGSGDTYNFDVNVDSVSDLDDLLKIKEQAQQRSRMK